MARYTQDYRLEESQDRNYSRVFRYLAAKGYIIKQHKGQTVFCKEGIPALGNHTMVQLNYSGDRLRLEAWAMCIPVSGFHDGELGIDGYYGIALKGELKRIVVELDMLLGGAKSRIGTNSYLRRKGGSFNSATTRVNPEVRSYGSDTAQRSRTEDPEPVRAPWQPEPVRHEPESYAPPVRKEPETYTPPVRKTPESAASQSRKAAPVCRETTADTPMDVNTCTQSQLLTLPGLTVAQAKRALEYREENGGFRSADEFVEVLELKPHFVVQILPKITVSAPQPRHEEEEEPTVRRVFDI